MARDINDIEIGRSLTGNEYSREKMTALECLIWMYKAMRKCLPDNMGDLQEILGLPDDDLYSDIEEVVNYAEEGIAQLKSGSYVRSRKFKRIESI